MIDIESLARPLSPEQPAGDNLEYSAEFQALESAARGKSEQQFGETLIPAEEPDWKDVETRALDLAARTRDVRVLGLLTRARTRLAGITGAAEGLQLIEQALSANWDHIHPQLDASDDDDPTMRLNALAALVAENGLLRDLRAAPFLTLRGFGTISVRQAEIALGLLQPRAEEAGVPTVSQLEGAAREAAITGTPNAAAEALATTRRLAAMLEAKVGASRALDLQPLLRRLEPLASIARGAPGEEAVAPAGDGGAPGPSSGARATAAPIAGITSREDAIRVLERVCEYLERSEPTNPAPLLIRRAQRWMRMSFVDIVREMAPEGMDSLQKITGVASEEN